jgi:site-specific DNA recombinase
VTLDARKATLTSALTDPPLPALHPQMAEVYRQKTTALAAGLEHDDQRDAARLALRGFLEEIVIPPGEELLQVVGNLGAMLTAAHGRDRTVGYVGCGGPQPPIPTALYVVAA